MLSRSPALRQLTVESQLGELVLAEVHDGQADSYLHGRPAGRHQMVNCVADRPAGGDGGLPSVHGLQCLAHPRSH